MQDGTEKKAVCIIRAKLKKDYVYDGISHYGYSICTPYKGQSLLFRIAREVWFRAKLPCRQIWYNRRIRETKADVFVIYDPLILPEFVAWVHQNHPDARIILSYENRADKTINPRSVEDYVEKWSYDKDDCEKYGMRFIAPSFFTEYTRTPERNPEYDVLYVGRDKGRAEYLFRIENELNKRGLKTYFHICADRKFLRYKKKYYKKLLSYDEYLELLVKSRAILNIVPEGQKSVTQREMEAAFSGMKCITNNRGILDFELYDPSIYFVIGHDDFETIGEFIRSRVRTADRETIRHYDFDERLQTMINGGE